MSFSNQLSSQFVVIPHCLIDNDSLSAGSIRVYTAIQSFFPAMFPSVAKICEITGFCRDTVFKYLKELKLKKVLKSYRRPNKSNVYEISPVLLSSKAIFRMQEALKKLLKFRKNGSRKKRDESMAKIGVVVGKDPTLTIQNTYIHTEKTKFSGLNHLKDVISSITSRI